MYFTVCSVEWTCGSELPSSCCKESEELCGMKSSDEDNQINKLFLCYKYYCLIAAEGSVRTSPLFVRNKQMFTFHKFGCCHIISDIMVLTGPVTL